LFVFQSFTLCRGDYIVAEFLDAVAKFGDTDVLGQTRSAGSRLSNSNSAYVNKEHFLSFKKFKDEVNFINNDGNIPFSAAVNAFSIMTTSERRLHLGLNASMDTLGNQYLEQPTSQDLMSLPDSIDWEEQGAMTPITNQGHCGSCWAHSATVAIEGGYFQVTGSLKQFSVQEILECTYEKENPALIHAKGKYNGCNGGWNEDSYLYIKEVGRLASLADMPYLGVDKPCNYKTIPNSLDNVEIVAVKMYKGDNGLLEAVSEGVVSVGIYVPDSLFMYETGVFEDPGGCLGPIFHAVNVIGYGRQEGRNFWRLRNSWGTEWAEN